MCPIFHVVSAAQSLPIILFFRVSMLPVLSPSVTSTNDRRLQKNNTKRFKIKHEGPEEWNNMWQKSRAIWKYIDYHYLEDFDWFVLGGDDVFLIIENLRKVKTWKTCRRYMCIYLTVAKRDVFSVPSFLLFFPVLSSVCVFFLSFSPHFLAYQKIEYA